MAQQVSPQRIFNKVERMCVELHVSGASLVLNETLKLALLGGDVSSVPARLEAHSFDIKDNCGPFDAMEHISQEHWPRGYICQSWDQFASNSLDRFEFARLGVRLDEMCMRRRGDSCGKKKRDSHTLREIFDGSRVSAAFLMPPPPPHLLTPDALSKPVMYCW